MKTMSAEPKPFATWFYPLTISLAVVALQVAVALTSELEMQIGFGLVVATAFGMVVALRERKLWALCTTDALTGLANRRQFQQALERELAQAKRYDQKVALMLVDCDHFKQINDKQGHAAGDAALRSLAGTLERTCRATDLVARWGGDEFAVLVSCEGEDEVAQLCERVQVAVKQTPLSVSIGFAVADTQHASSARPSALFSAADQALYSAKRLGPGHVVSAQHAPKPLKPGTPSVLDLLPVGLRVVSSRRSSQKR